MKRIWYGVYANNGLGVYTDGRKLNHDYRYIRGKHVRGFSGQDEAEEYVIDGFASLHGVEVLMTTVPDLGQIRLNYFYFKKAVKELGELTIVRAVQHEQEQQQLSKYAYEGGLINGKHISKAISLLTEDEKENYILYGTFKEVQS
ncbi:MAG TPA: hypothetical protein DDY31_17255 [Lachnospiraceae bacterium]|nr:hypothetical protein [Lachnospiraceae bacterium]